MTLPNGTIVGDYEIIGVLGQGGMGAVYKVRNTISDRVEAMKVLLPNLAAEPGLADRFLREIKLVAKLDHPNITGLRTAFRANDQLWMVMELVDGSSLEQVLRVRKLSVEECIRYTVQALDALAYAHELGIVHRDLKPANIILTRTGNVKITDFGIARTSGDSRLTHTGTALGSIAYMSPEQIQRSTVDARSDLYSLGITLYELLTGQLPFNAESEFAIMSAHVMNPPRPPVELNPAILPHLSQIILRSLEKDPAHRFQTARDFRDAIQPDSAAVTRISAPAQLPTALAPAAKPLHAKWIIAAGLLAAAAGIALVLIPRPQPAEPAPEPPVAKTTAATPSPSPPPSRQAVATPAPTAAPTAAPTPDPAQAAWETLKTSTSVDALNTFREKHAGTNYARLAFLRIVEVQYEAARDSHDPARLRRFIVTHPNSPFTAQAKTELEQLEKTSLTPEITKTFDKFRTACESRNLPALRAVWPTLAGRRLQMTAGMLKNAKSITVRIDITGDLQTNGDNVMVPIRYQHEAVRPNGERIAVDEKTTLTMRKVGSEWVIQNFPLLRTQQSQ